MVEHRDLFRDADGVLCRKNDPQLTDPDASRLQPDEQVEQHGAAGYLESLDVEVMLGEADRVVAEIVGQASLRREVGQHALVEIAPEARHATFDLGAAPDGGQIEERYAHRPLS